MTKMNAPLLPVSPSVCDDYDLQMLDAIYFAVKRCLRKYGNDPAELGYLQDAAKEFKKWWDNERKNEDNKDARDYAITEFGDTICGQLPLYAYLYYKKHADWEGVLGNIATTICEYDPEEDNDDSDDEDDE